ncbi:MULTISPECIES: CYTH and CHAD domain-containing protein [Subtercola]|uniref:CHAD domain-containing protein n=1 Tax=Subtercola vilae TaxID=2056433 RepID=A0A4T2C955_9MICO|nr:MULTISPECIES: CYTH and CHAD domain-containing protein [Subtercola]MEA9985009.1 CYTH and CHAD domain-containing protein [Subtercola sp. RTI3]TIH39951.1 CHAD domain-containing protein [Subtercola vilae]
MNHQVHIEIERKYDVADSSVVPDLIGVASIASASEPDTVTLEAVYFDTPDLALAAQRIVLRRRVGGADEGWHIKLPGDEGRTELHWPLGDESPIPEAVLDLVMVHVRDREVSPVARLTTTRTTTCLFDDSGRALAEICDDLVSAGDVMSGQVRVWREWEVELAEAAPGSPKKRQALLDAIEHELGRAGAMPASSVSKLAHALGRERLGDPAPRWELTSKSSAGDVLRAAVAEQTLRLKAADPLVRQDEAGAVHTMRSSVRRLRSVLATYRSILSSPEAKHLESELRAFGGVLGDARDPQVMHDRARDLVRSQSNKRMHEAVLARLVVSKEAEYQRALAYLRRLMSSARYFRLLDALEAFSAMPSFNPKSERPAAKALAKGISDDYRRVRERMAAVNDAANPEEWNLRIHHVRKAARRLRFGVEAVSSGDTAIFGDKARRLAGAAERVQDALGEYRDSLTLQELLVSTSAVASAEGENTFGFGRLHALEQVRSDQALAEYARARAEFTDAKKWLPSR